MLKKFWTCISILYMGVLIGLVLLIGAFSLPTKNMYNNIKRSSIILEEEGTYPQIFKGHTWSNLDNFTDAIMLTNVIGHESKTVLENALKVNRISYNEKTPVESLASYVNGDKGYYTYSYARYWHGYLIILKPLFLFLDYTNIRIVNLFVQTLLILILVFQFSKIKIQNYSTPLSISILSMCPIAIYKSLQFSWIFYITLIAMIIMLWKKDWVLNNSWKFFLIVGMVTSYFDLLTFPLVTLGFPLVLYFILKDFESIKEACKNWIALCFFWGIGYAGMWSGKWLIATILVKENVIANAISSVLQRVSRETATTSFSTLDSIARNTDVIWSEKVILAFLILYITYILIKCFIKKRVNLRITLILPVCLTSLLPLLWYVVLSNHTYIHFWFTYRLLAISIWGCLCTIANLCDTN